MQSDQPAGTTALSRKPVVNGTARFRRLYASERVQKLAQNENGNQSGGSNR